MRTVQQTTMLHLTLNNQLTSRWTGTNLKNLVNKPSSVNRTQRKKIWVFNRFISHVVILTQLKYMPQVKIIPLSIPLWIRLMLLIWNSTILRRYLKLDVPLSHLRMPILIKRNISDNPHCFLRLHTHNQLQFKQILVTIVLEHNTIPLLTANRYLVLIKSIQLRQIKRRKNNRKHIFVPSLHLLELLFC